VVEINVITETVRVNTGEVREYPLDQVTRKHADAKQAHGSEPDAQADDVQQDDAQADDVQEE
jgi:hypothetical protein